MWTCPHCGAPQAEAARCWVCRRSSTTCSTCRNFRTSLAADVGFCAKDRRRAPLTGRELRGCWEENRRPAVPTSAATAEHGRASVGGARAGGPGDRPDPMRLRGFVPLDELVPMATSSETRTPAGGADRTAGPPVPPPVVAEALDAWLDRTSLFGDAEP